METLITGQYQDKRGRTYILKLEPAIDLGDGSYIITFLERSFVVWRVS